MAGRYDHFHAVYDNDGEEGEIEGGWLGYPEGWNNMSREHQDAWTIQLCETWGMPHGATIKRMWLAG